MSLPAPVSAALFALSLLGAVDSSGADRAVYTTVQVNTLIGGGDPVPAATTLCHCRMWCLSKPSCTAASFTGPKTCVTSALGPRNITTANMTGSVTLLKYKYPLPVFHPFFKTVAKSGDGTIATLTSKCAAEGGEPGLILDKEEYDWIKANIASSIGSSWIYVAAKQTSSGVYVWANGDPVISSTGLYDATTFIDHPQYPGVGVVLMNDMKLNRFRLSAVLGYNVLCRRA